MKVFYLKKDDILEKVGLEELEKYSDGKSYSLEEKYIEHLEGYGIYIEQLSNSIQMWLLLLMLCQ